LRLVSFYVGKSGTASASAKRRCAAYRRLKHDLEALSSRGIMRYAKLLVSLCILRNAFI